MFSKTFAGLHYYDKYMGTITLLALFSFTLREDTFSAARVGSSMHSNLRMHHISGDSPNHEKLGSQPVRYTRCESASGRTNSWLSFIEYNEFHEV